MATKALIFDLDETLVADIEATRRALVAATQAESVRAALAGVAPEALARSVWDAAQRLWIASAHAAYAEAIGMASWEALWARYDGEAPEVRALHAWVPSYRRQAWREALSSQDVADADDALADRLQSAFLDERRALSIIFPDAIPALEQLKARYRLAILTNGESGLQREKLEIAGLGGYFEVVVASGDLGAGKPDPRTYTQTLAALGSAPDEVVMIGDNPVNDVAGAQRAGMRGVWLYRGEDPAIPPDEVQPDAVIPTLAELAAAIDAL